MSYKEYASKEWVKENTIPSPVAAEVGQTIIVKAVDENGKPTEWKAIDASLPEYYGKLETEWVTILDNYEMPEGETYFEITLPVDFPFERLHEGLQYEVVIGERTYKGQTKFAPDGSAYVGDISPEELYSETTPSGEFYIGVMSDYSEGNREAFFVEVIRTSTEATTITFKAEKPVNVEKVNPLLLSHKTSIIGWDEDEYGNAIKKYYDELSFPRPFYVSGSMVLFDWGNLRSACVHVKVFVNLNLCRQETGSIHVYSYMGAYEKNSTLSTGNVVFVARGEHEYWTSCRSKFDTASNTVTAFFLVNEDGKFYELALTMPYDSAEGTIKPGDCPYTRTEI